MILEQCHIMGKFPIRLQFSNLLTVFEAKIKDWNVEICEYGLCKP